MPQQFGEVDETPPRQDQSRQIRTAETLQLLRSIHEQAATAPDKPRCLALKHRELRRLLEDAFATVTKVQREYVENLILIANLHETVPVYISIKDGHHRVFGDSNYCPLTAVGQNCHSGSVQLESALSHYPCLITSIKERRPRAWVVWTLNRRDWIIPEVLHRDNPAKTVLRDNHYQHRPHRSEPLRSWDESMWRTLPLRWTPSFGQKFGSP